MVEKEEAIRGGGRLEAASRRVSGGTGRLQGSGGLGGVQEGRLDGVQGFVIFNVEIKKTGQLGKTEPRQPCIVIDMEAGDVSQLGKINLLQSFVIIDFQTS